jgi:hypothetical protein
MSTRKISNVKIHDFRRFLEKCDCKNIGIEGGHEKWARKDLTRPIIVQTHIEPVPEFIIQNALRNLGLTKKDYFRVLEENSIS